MFNLFKKPLPKHPIFLYNTASQTLEEFVALKKNEVSIYACGPTVYDHIHIGNLRAYLLPDLLHKLFLYNGYRVKLVINFTDFGHLSDDGDEGEDKIMGGMKKAGLPITIEAMREFVLPYIDSFKSDNVAFGNLPATTYARASDYVQQQIKLIQTLEQKGYTYEIDDGVYFDIEKFPAYGRIGNVDITKLKAGARVAVNADKRHPADFALWKKGDLGWESVWGVGFPGWHTECTAMIFDTLGRQIDIHTGGEDLKYTHHNAEIAQAECTTGKQYVKYWLHNAHITIEQKKIAKSTGNGIRLSQLVERGYDPLDYRYWLLTSHYRTNANFSFTALDAAKQARARLLRIRYKDLAGIRPTTPNEKYEQEFLVAMHQDLDTPKAIAILWDMAKDESLAPGEKLASLIAFDALLTIGLNIEDESAVADMGFVSLTVLPTEIQELVDTREAARVAKNWDEADRLREALTLKGYAVEDGTSGPTVSKM